MAAPSGEFDLSELLAQLARSGLEACCARGLVFLYDHEGQHAVVRGPEERFAALVSAMLARAIHLARGGHVFCGAHVATGNDGNCHVVVQVALNAPIPEFPAEWAALGEMEGTHWSGPAANGLGGVQTLTARGADPGTQLAVLGFGDAGVVVRLEAQMPWVAPAGPWADARGARAWLVAPSTHRAYAETLARRLQRLGWHISHFAAPADAHAHLKQRPEEFAPPLLILGIVEHETCLADLERLAQDVPQGTTVLHARLPGGPQGDEAKVLSCALPLGLAELLALTRGVCERVPPPSGRTQPSPLSTSARRHVLLLMTNPVEQAVAIATLHTLGYEVAVADTPEEAVAHCERYAPHALLIDLPSDGRGIAALRGLSRRKLDGSLPDVRLVAASANPGLHEAALAAGADMALAKPLDPGALQRALGSTESRC